MTVANEENEINDDTVMNDSVMAEKIEEEAIKERKTTRMRGSMVPFLMGATTATVANYLFKAEKRTKVKEQFEKIKNQAQEMTQDKDIKKVVDENKEDAIKMAQTFKEKVSSKENDQKKNVENENQGNKKNQRNLANETETGGF